MSDFNSSYVTLVLSAKEAESFDKSTIESGLPSRTLTEIAGFQTALMARHELEKMAPQMPVCAVFVGLGNNGADGLVAARHLWSLGVACSIFLPKLPASKNLNDETKYQLDLCQSLSKTIQNFFQRDPIISFDDTASLEKHFAQASSLLIVDALFGSGLKRPPEGLYGQTISWINSFCDLDRTKRRILSIDIPSGLGLDAHPGMGLFIRAEQTITFQHLKRSHVSEPTKKWCGHIEAVPIGLFKPKDFVPTVGWVLETSQPLFNLLLPLKKDAHKNAFGHVMVLEGAKEYRGASRLASLAALRVGAGLVTLLTKNVHEQALNDPPELMKREYKQVSPDLFFGIRSLVIGCGLGQDPKNSSLVRDMIASASPTVSTIVLDADALKMAPGTPLNMDPSCQLICTPHPGEAAYLLGKTASWVQENRFLALAELLEHPTFKDHNPIWVLKGATPLVGQKGQPILGFEGELPLLSIGGTGDTLSGAIAGLLFRSNNPFHATLLAVSLILATARHLAKSASKGILPSEISQRFPYILNDRK